MLQVNDSIFRAYDIRGIYPDEINPDVAYAIAQAYAQRFHPKTVVLGHDVRLSGPTLAFAVERGLSDAGVNVVYIGEISTDMMYFAVAHYGYDGGLVISASHNPREYNGVKMVLHHAEPVIADTGLADIKELVQNGNVFRAETNGKITKQYILDDYCQKVLSFLKIPLKKQYRIVANANYGMAGMALRRLIDIGELPVEVVGINFFPDGSFPKGRPDPMIPELRLETTNTIKESNVDFGVAWDGDADRCFFYSQDGEAYEAYYTTALFAGYFLHHNPGARIYSDSRLIWAIRDIVAKNHGELVIGRAGHSFIKEIMRKDNITFGGEASGHYYFKDAYFADNGMVPLVIMLQLLESVEKISDLYTDLLQQYAVSGETNFRTHDQQRLLQDIADKYKDCEDVTHIDGDSYAFADWRFNIRVSHTEPLIRLNIEGYDRHVVEERKNELVSFITSLPFGNTLDS